MNKPTPWLPLGDDQWPVLIVCISVRIELLLLDLNLWEIPIGLANNDRG